MDFLSHIDLSPLQWGLMAVCGLLIGMSKVGVPGVSMLVVPTLAFIFGGKQSTGVLLPMLLMADVFGVGYYRRHAQWKYLLKIFPWAFIGIGLALWVGEIVSDKQFKELIAILVFFCIALMLWRDRKKGKDIFPNRIWFAASMGILGGFATMIGNIAGPIFAIYLLAMNLPKNNFIGTGAWFFLILNFIKFPLHLFVWKTISATSLSINLATLPTIALGAYLGIILVKTIPEKTYRTFVIAITAISAMLLLF